MFERIEHLENLNASFMYNFVNVGIIVSGPTYIFCELLIIAGVNNKFVHS
jgi:hypothetical protein